MVRRALIACLLATAVLVPMKAEAASRQDLGPTFCRVAIQEESLQLENAELDAELAHSRFLAFESILELIEGLWDAPGFALSRRIVRGPPLQYRYAPCDPEPGAASGSRLEAVDSNATHVSPVVASNHALAARLEPPMAPAPPGPTLARAIIVAPPRSRA